MKYAIVLAAILAAILAASPAVADYVRETRPNVFGNNPQQFQRDMATWDLQIQHNFNENRYMMDKLERDNPPIRW